MTETKKDQFQQLSEMTVIVSDTGDIDEIRKYKPTDATTNPSLILAASEQKQYQHLVSDAIEYARTKASDEKSQIALALDKLAVNFGVEIVQIVSGVVSTEVDARLSFDTPGTIKKAKELIALYAEAGVPKERILVKIASTWEGIRAAEQLERDGIHCNMTLLFNFAQAVACAEGGVTLISPFVGRIRDWYCKDRGVSDIKAEEDPGVTSVSRIYNYYKKHGHNTIVMGASFRSLGEILCLAGCDKLTIGPNWLQALKNSTEPVTRHLTAESAMKMDIPKESFDELAFRWAMNEDPMATEKLAEGIRKFAADTLKLEAKIRARLRAASSASSQ
jgi:transaldolase